MMGRKSFLVFINDIIGAVTGFLGMFFIARFMANPSYNYGIVSFAIGFAGMFGFIGRLFDDAHVKRLSEDRDEGECMGTYISLTTISVAIMLSLSYGSILIWKHVLGRGFESTIHEKVLYIIIIFWAIKLLSRTVMKTLQAEKKIARMEVIRFMDRNVPTIFIIFVALTGGRAIELSFTYLAGGLMMALVALYYLRNYPIKKPSLNLAKSYWVFGLPMFLIALTGKLGNRLDIVMVQAYWSSTDVGYYMASRRFAMIVNSISFAAGLVIFPTISSLYSDLDWNRIRTVVGEGSRYLSMLAVPLTLFLFIFPKQVIHILLSNDFLPAAPVMRILSINAFFMVLSTPFLKVFGGINKPKLGAKIVVTCNIINLGLNFVLIPQAIAGIPLFGLKEIGAGLATLISTMTLFLLSVIFANRESGVKPYMKIPLHVGSGILTGIILYLLEKQLLPIFRYYHLIFYGFLFVGIYTVILYLVGEFGKEEWDYIMATIHPGEMLAYIKEELKR